MSGIRIDVDTRADKAQRDLTQINESLKNIQGTATKVTENLSGMVRSFAALAAGGGALAYVTSIANEFANLNNQIKLVVGETRDLVKIQSKLVDLSIKNRVELSATAKIYSTLGKNVANAAASSDQLLEATEGIQKAVALSGSAAESATAAIVQLGQGLASGTLRGEELNSVMEQTPRLAKAIADGLGLSLGQMRALAAEGKITSTAVFDAILSQTKKLNDEFAKMTPTMSQAFTSLNTGVKSFVSELDQGLGTSGAIAAQVIKMANYLNDASLSARAFGAVLSYELTTAVQGIARIGGPIVNLFSALGTHIAKAMPRVDFTRTIFGDFLEGLRKVDDAAGGAFTTASHLIRFGLYDLLTYDSAAEKAIKKIKRLSPQYWLTGGVNTATLSRIFSAKTIRDYGDAFEELAKAIEGNTNSFFIKAGENFRRFQYTVRDTLRYFGMLPDTLLTFRVGDIDAFNYSMTELLRGVTGVQLKFTEVGKLFREVFNTSTMRLQLALEDIAMALPESVYEGIKKIFDLVMSSLPHVKQIIKDFMLANEWEIPEIKLPKMDIFKNMKMPSTRDIGKVFDVFEAGRDKIISMSMGVAKAFKDVRESVMDTYKGVKSYVLDVFDDLHDRIKDFTNSETTLEKFSRYFTDFSAVIATLLGPATALWMIFLNVATASSLAMDPTMARRFRDTLVDVLEWAAKFAPNFANATAKFFGLHEAMQSALMWSGAWLAIGNVVEATATMVSFGIHTMVEQIGKLYRVSLPDQMFNSIMDSMEGRIAKFTDFLKKVLDKVITFGKGVIRVFFEIWDEVVGHSWWPDTIDGVVKYAEKLTDRVMPSMERFQDYINGIFSGLHDSTGSFDAREIAIKIKVTAVNIKDAVQNLVGELYNEFPNLVRGIGFGVAALVGYMLLPMNKLVGVMLADLALTAASNLSIFAETLSENVFGTSLSKNLGESIGAAVADYMAALVKALPGVINLIVTTAYGFAKAFIEGIVKSLPLGIGTILGGITESLLRVVDVLGIGGPLGVIGLFFFGRSGLQVLQHLKIFDKQIKGIFGFFSGAMSYTKTGGAISTFLFGASQKSILAGIAMIMALTGSFDSLFSGSLIAKYGTMGLIGYTLFGGNPVKLAASAWSQVIMPVFASLNGAATSSNSLIAKMLSSITQSRKAMGLLIAAVLFFKSSMASAAETSVAEAPTDYFGSMIASFKRTMSTIGTFVDERPAEAFAAAWVAALGASWIFKVTKSFIAIKDASVSTASAIVKATRLDKAFEIGANALSIASSFIPTFSGGFKKAMEAISTQWGALVAFMGTKLEWFKYQWYLFTTSSFAAPFFSAISSMMGNLAIFYARFIGYVEVMQARFMAFVTKFRVAAAGLTLGAGVGALSLAGGADMMDAVSNATLAVLAFKSLPAKIAGSIASIMGKIGGFIMTILTWSKWLTGLVGIAIGGILSVFFFGEGDTFFEKLDDAIHKLLRFIGLTSDIRKNSAQNKERSGKITGDMRSLVSEQGLGQLPDFAGVNFDLLNDTEKRAIDRVLDKYVSALNSAGDEFADTGRVSAETKASLEKLSDNLQAIVDKGAAKSMKSMLKDAQTFELDAQANHDGVLPRMGTWFRQAGLDISYGLQMGLSKARRTLYSLTPGDDGKQAMGRETDLQNELRNRANTDFKAGYRKLGADDLITINQFKDLKNGAANNAALFKELGDAYTDYKDSVQDYFDKLQDNTGGNSGGAFTGSQMEAALTRKDYAGSRLRELTRQAKAYEEREAAVLSFNNSLSSVQATLKEANVQFDANMLLNSDSSTWEGVVQGAAAIKALDKMLKETNKAEGVRSFEERVAVERRKMEISTVMLINAQHAYDRVYSSTQAAMGRLSESIGLGFDKDAINRIGSDVGTALVAQMQDIELLKKQLASDVSIANIVFPANTNEDVKAAIASDSSKTSLLQYIADLERTLKDRMRKSFRVSDYLKSITDLTGVQFSGQDVANDNASTIAARFAAADKIQRAQQRLEGVTSAYDKVKPENLTPAMKAALVQEQALFETIKRDANESVKLATPDLEAFNAKIERMSSISGVAVNQLLKLPKAMDILGQTDSATFKLWDVDPLVVLRQFDSEIQRTQKQLDSTNNRGSAAGIALRTQLETLKKQAAALGAIIVDTLDNAATVVSRIASSGLSFQLSEWFAIDSATLKGLDDAAKRINSLKRDLENIDPKMSMPEFQKKSKELAKAVADQKNSEEVARAQIASEQFQFQNFNGRLSTLNSSFGGSVDKQTYSANKDAFDKVTQGFLELNRAFAELPEDMKQQAAKGFELAGEELRRTFVKLNESGPDSNKNLVAKLSSVGASTDLGGVNRMSADQITYFDKWAEAIREQQQKASNADLSQTERQTAQNIVDSQQYRLTEALKFATLKPEERPVYQAASTFANTITDSFVNGIKDVLAGKSSTKDFIKSFADTFTSQVINTLMEGFMAPFTGENGVIKQGLRELGASLFDWGGVASGANNPQQVFSNAVDRFAMAVNSKAVPSGVKAATPEKEGATSSWLSNTWDELRLGFSNTMDWVSKGLTGAFQAVFGANGILSQIGGAVAGLFSGSSSSGGGDWFGQALGVAGKFFSSGSAQGYATGGAIAGAGTGTSDSIPAMLSHGEFVINAESAAKFRPILEAINNGTYGKFSEGGSVGDSGGFSNFMGVDYGSLSSVTSSLSSMTSSLGDVYFGISGLASATTDYSRVSSNVLGAGFSDVGKGMFNMGQVMQQGFTAVGLAMVNSQKPGKFNWVGAALTIAGAAIGAYNSLSTASSAYQLQGGALGSGTSYGTGLKMSGGTTGLRLAEGGFVSGPGSWTSDSIPAMLSNGEYVVNAASVARFKPLLDQINSGKFPAFSTGGYVTSGYTAIEQSVSSEAAKKETATKEAVSSQQVFNINVTGDISRQTRSEIQKMIPSIATGVNAHNSEKGIKR